MPQDSSNFSRDQWETLKRAPLLVLQQVAGADSLIDQKERSALIDAVAAAAEGEPGLVRDVMVALAAELHEDVESGPPIADALEGLRAAAVILESVDPAEASAFKVALLRIGSTVAEASGGQLVRTFNARQGTSWQPAGGTSAQEREALLEAAEALGIAP